MIDPSLYSPDRSLPAKLKRRLTYWRAAKPMRQTPRRGMISFTFDDFPKSAAQYGANALEDADAKGTFYTCTGMMGKTNLMGDMYNADDLEALASRGHEIAAHTHNHIDCGRVDPATVRSEICHNLAELQALKAPTNLPHFAWPYGETTLTNKTKINDLVCTARGILPGINKKGSDLMQLGAFELTPDQWTTKRAADAIEATAQKGGWTIIFTHDVRKNPSAFGTTPESVRHLAKQSRDAGLDILTMSEAFARLEEGHA
ncbi:MAG: polysaccharide deacetylase family protein [Pseudomonadota bacterium]